jgi:bacterial/archaeal transporter family protein
MSRFKGQLRAALASLSFGISPLFTKKGLLAGVHPLTGLAIAIVMGLFVNILLVGLSGEWKELTKTRKHGFFFALAAAGCNTVAAVAYFGALSMGKVALVVPISCIYPLFTLMAVLLFLQKSEPIDVWTVLGTLLIVGGILLIV